MITDKLKRLEARKEGAENLDGYIYRVFSVFFQNWNNEILNQTELEFF